MPLVATKNSRIPLEIAEQITLRIRAGIYQPGERIPAERTLARLFNVSRSSIREALVVLETESRIEVRGGSGVYITNRKAASTVPLMAKPTAALGSFEILQARTLLEPVTALLAAENSQEHQLADLRRALMNMVCCTAGDPGYFEYDRQFHLCLAEASGNNALYLAVEILWNYQTESIHLSRQDPLCSAPAWQNEIIEHREILIAITNRDSQAAHTAMSAHLKRSQTRLSVARTASNSPSQELLVQI